MARGPIRAGTLQRTRRSALPTALDSRGPGGPRRCRAESARGVHRCGHRQQIAIEQDAARHRPARCQRKAQGAVAAAQIEQRRPDLPGGKMLEQQERPFIDALRGKTSQGTSSDKVGEPGRALHQPAARVRPQRPSTLPVWEAGALWPPGGASSSRLAAAGRPPPRAGPPRAARGRAAPHRASAGQGSTAISGRPAAPRPSAAVHHPGPRRAPGRTGARGPRRPRASGFRRSSSIRARRPAGRANGGPGREGEGVPWKDRGLRARGDLLARSALSQISGEIRRGSRRQIPCSFSARWRIPDTFSPRRCTAESRHVHLLNNASRICPQRSPRSVWPLYHRYARRSPRSARHWLELSTPSAARRTAPASSSSASPSALGQLLSRAARRRRQPARRGLAKARGRSRPRAGRSLRTRSARAGRGPRARTVRCAVARLASIVRAPPLWSSPTTSNRSHISCSLE